MAPLLTASLWSMVSCRKKSFRRVCCRDVFYF
jgi:hypothetical protein